MRGLRRTACPAVISKRYNPACAGTTPCHMAFLADAMIQPRVCGDYRMKRGIKKRFLDTTPRVRGLPEPQVRPASPYRYNPACAGTTPALPQTAPHNPIQPRVCGDYIQICTSGGSIRDTTPRVRGLLPSRTSFFLPYRYNPACAGTTPKNLWH